MAVIVHTDLVFRFGVRVSRGVRRSLGVRLRLGVGFIAAVGFGIVIFVDIGLP